MIQLKYGNLSGMKSELQGSRDLSAFRHFEIGVLVLRIPLLVGGVSYLDRRKLDKMGFVPKVR